MRKLPSLASLALLAVACSGAPPSGTRTPGSAAPTVAPVVTTSPSATAVPTPTRATRTPVPTPRVTQAPDSNASQGTPLLFTWSSNGYVTAQILLPITNTGGTWIELLEYDSQWTIYNESGGIVETGSFDAAAPDAIMPGVQSYLVAEWFGDDHPRGDFVTIEADGYYREINQPDGVLIAGNVNTRKHSLGGVQVVGELDNFGPVVDNCDVVALFFDAQNNLLGFARGYAENIPANGTRAFQIDSSFAEIKLSDIVETFVIASPW